MRRLLRDVLAWLSPEDVAPAFRLRLLCDFCGARRRHLTADECAQVRELGWLPCDCGGSAFPVLPAEVPL